MSQVSQGMSRSRSASGWDGARRQRSGSGEKSDVARSKSSSAIKSNSSQVKMALNNAHLNWAKDDAGRGKVRRAKRSGYNHVAAKSSHPDMLYLPDGGCHVNPLKERNVDPFLFSTNPAGVTSDRTAKMEGWIADMGASQKKPVYYPSQEVDPITHQADPMKKDNYVRDATSSQGAAGVLTARLTRLAMGPMTQDRSEVKKRENKQQKDSTGIFESADAPADTGDRKRGLKMFKSKSAVATISTTHRGGKPEPLPPDVLKAHSSSSSKIVAAGDKYLYYSHGPEDMVPGATRPYAKADRPPSAAHRFENDKRYLASCDRDPRFARTQSKDKRIGESADMEYVFGAKKEEYPFLDGISNLYDVAPENPMASTIRSLQQPLVVAGAYQDKLVPSKERPASARPSKEMIDTGPIRIGANQRPATARAPSDRGYRSPPMRNRSPRMSPPPSELMSEGYSEPRSERSRRSR